MNSTSQSLRVPLETPVIFERVLTIGPEYKNHRGGIGAVLEEYAANIDQFNFLASYKPGNWLSIGVHYVRFLFSYIWFLIKHRNVKIVHIHTSSYGSFIRKSVVVLIAKLFRKQSIMHIHGSEFQVFYKRFGLLKPYIRAILRSNDLIICLSPQWADFFATFMSREKLYVLNNPVSGKYKVAKNKTTDKIRFLFLGRIGQRKGIFDALNAVSEMSVEKKSKMKLVVGGDGEIEKFTTIIKEPGMGQAVEYAGWVSGEKKSALLSNSDVYILPSYNEGLPISILEAMVSSLPIISTPVGGIPEIVKSGRNGKLVEPGDVNGIKEAMEFFIDNPGKVTEYGIVSGEMAEPFIIDSVLKELQVVYEKMLTNAN